MPCRSVTGQSKRAHPCSQHEPASPLAGAVELALFSDAFERLCRALDPVLIVASVRRKELQDLIASACAGSADGARGKIDSLTDLVLMGLHTTLLHTIITPNPTVLQRFFALRLKLNYSNQIALWHSKKRLWHRGYAVGAGRSSDGPGNSTARRYVVPDSRPGIPAIHFGRYHEAYATLRLHRPEMQNRPQRKGLHAESAAGLKREAAWQRLPR